MFTLVRTLLTIAISVVDYTFGSSFGTSTTYQRDLTTISKQERYEVVQGKSNSILIVDESGFQFRKGGYTNQTGKTTWYCSKRTSLKCRAKVVTEGEFIVLQKCQHNHDSQQILTM